MIVFILAILLVPLVLAVSFFTVMTIENMLEAGLRVPGWIVFIGKILYPVGALADITFNVFPLFAPLMAKELHPHGATFSNRVQWHIDHPDSYWYEEALIYARVLNFVRKNHIKRVPV